VGSSFHAEKAPSSGSAGSATPTSAVLYLNFFEELRRLVVTGNR
jgi:hypothetical protein